MTLCAGSQAVQSGQMDRHNTANSQCAQLFC